MNMATDVELRELTKYLLAIAPLPDFGVLRHSRWESYIADSTYE
jgi:hypothetical protein